MHKSPTFFQLACQSLVAIYNYAQVTNFFLFQWTCQSLVAIYYYAQVTNFLFQWACQSLVAIYNYAQVTNFLFQWACQSLVAINNYAQVTIFLFQWACQSLVAIYNYAQVTNFFWMLVEGLYLHIIIVWTYSADKIRKWYFIVIGWGRCSLASTFSVLKLIEICNFVGLLHTPFWFQFVLVLLGHLFPTFETTFWLRITDEGSVPQMRIWSILII